MRYAVVLMVGYLVATQAVVAQSAEKKLAEEVIEESQQDAMADPTLESTFTATQDAIKFEAGQAEKKATAQLSFGGTNIRSAFVKVTAPVNENAEEQTLANLHGLTGSALEIGFWHRLSRVKFVDVDTVEWERICSERGEKNSCNVYRFGEAIASRAIKTTGMTSAAGMSFEYARPKFEYLTTDTLAVNKEHLREYAGTFAYGLLPNIGRLYFAGVDFRYETSYEAKPKQQICMPLDGSTALRCVTSAIGAPERTTKRIGELRTRWFASRDVVFDVVIARDFNSDAMGIEVPIVFSRSGKDNLFNGGVRLGWRSDTNEVTAGVFVGAMRDVLGSR